MLQKYDAERDEAQRKFHADVMGAEFKDSASKTPKSPPSNGCKNTMTQEDIMRNYGK